MAASQVNCGDRHDPDLTECPKVTIARQEAKAVEAETARGLARALRDLEDHLAQALDQTQTIRSLISGLPPSSSIAAATTTKVRDILSGVQTGRVEKPRGKLTRKRGEKTGEEEDED
ncbi:MAG: hypothetical protein Q9218_004838 [Villophora microphyllina]